MLHNFRSTLSYILQFKTNSIHLRNLLIITAFVTIPIIILSVLLFNFATVNTNEEIRNMHLGVLENAQRNVDTEFTKIEDLLYSLSTNSSINSLRMMDSINSMEYATLDRLTGLFNLFKMSQILNPNIQNIFIYFESSNIVIDSYGYIINKNESHYKANIDEFWSELDKSRKRFLIVEKSEGVNNSFYLVYCLPEFGVQNRGLSVVRIEERSINTILNNTTDTGKYENMILEKDGRIISDKDQQRIGQRMDNGIVEKLGKDRGFFLQKDVNTQKAWVYITSPRTGWKYVSLVSLDWFYAKLNYFKRIFVIITVISIAAAVFCSLFVTNKLSEPINVLLSLLDNHDSWFSKEQAAKVKFAEIKMIGTNYLSSYKENLELKHSLQERVALLKKAQFAALQSQINPHFLYNTLESINWSIREKLGLENTPSDLINSLSEFLRFSLEDEDSLICIRSEVENLKHYIAIQQFRYSGSFTVIWEMPEELYQYKMIKITLQPLVENAISHGIKIMGRGGVIKISGLLEQNSISLRVQDNGRGMDERKVQELADYIDDNTFHLGESIGLKNVNLRHHILFGENYGMMIKSRSGEGTLVSIRFPVIPL